MHQYFPKAITILYLLISLCAFQTYAHSSAPSLQLNNISFDNENSNNIKQIVFVFNQDIAILGAIPSQAQINSVNMSHGVSTQCGWRFVKLNMLACELREALPLFANIHISMKDSFQGLNAQLDTNESAVTTAIISTSLPNIRLRESSTKAHFPNSFTTSAYAGQNLRIWPRQLALYKDMLSALRLLKPNGNYQKVEYLVEQERDDYLRLKVIIPLKNEKLEDGLYKLVIPKGFSPHERVEVALKDSFRTLANDEVIYEFRYSHGLAYYGVACEPSERLLDFIKPSNTSLLKCPPESIEFVFSRELQSLTNNDNNEQVKWLQGPEYKMSGFTKAGNSYYYKFALQGNSNYELMLANVKSDEGESLNQQETSSFVTAKATSDWYMPFDGLNVVESDRNTPIYFLRRNVADMQRGLVAIQSAQDLQAYLNRKKPSLLVDTKLDPTAGTINKMGQQAMGFRQALSQPSGLVEVNLAGSHNNDAIDYASNGKPIFKEPVNIKKNSFLANTAAFNLAVWHHKNLLIQAIDWDANPLKNADVSLVCENGKAPVELGFTSDSGLLFVPEKQWSKIYQDYVNKDCWLWANGQKGSAAIGLNEVQVETSYTPKIKTFTAQPIYELGDVVHLGVVAKQRVSINSAMPLLPMKNFDGYDVQIMHPNSDNVYTQLEMSALTPNGFSSASFTLDNAGSVGYYSVVIKHKVSGDNYFVGGITVKEFTPPEFDMNLSLPQKMSTLNDSQAHINKGERLKAKISAKRLNGGLLVNAKVSTRYQLQYSYQSPQAWPQDYAFTSYEEFERSDASQKLELKGGEGLKLNDVGVLNFQSEEINTTAPIADITFTAEVTADDGETQSASDSVLYLSREHYIGTKLNGDNQHLDLMAINKSGKEITDIAVKVTFSKRNNANNKQWEKLSECELSSLPATCKLPASATQLQVNITSGSQQYKSLRSVYAPSVKKPAPEIDYPEIAFVLEEAQDDESDEAFARTSFPAPWERKIVTATAGEPLNLTLRSNIAGSATFIVVAGNIQKVWQEALTVGENTITLPIEEAWIPSAKVIATLAVGRTITDALADKLNPSLDTGSSAFIKDRLPSGNSPNLRHLGQFRFLTASVELALISSAPAPEVTILPASKQVLAGGELSISLQANTQVETQLWLVNDGLLAMVGFDINSLDPATFYLNEAQADNQVVPNSLAQRSLTNQEFLNSDAEALIQVTGSRAAFDETESFSLFAPSKGKSNSAPQAGSSFTKKDFAQSIWLNTLSLKADTPKTIKVKLPQLIGRWKIIAMNITKHQSSMSSAEVTTVKDVEYFLDAPSAIFDSDKSKLALTQINNTDSAKEDELTLWIDDKAIKRVKVALAVSGSKEAYKRVQVELPTLLAGKHTIHITSQRDKSFAAYAELLVLASDIAKQTTWLVGPNNSALARPPQIDEESLTLTASPSGGEVPNWAQLNKYNKDYPHEGWEPTISRAITYAYAPNAEESWPQGSDELNKLLAKRPSYTNGLEQYSYFPDTPSDGFLSAYTFFAYSLLKDSSTPVLLNVEATVSNLREYLEIRQYKNASRLTQSMALLALAANNSISLNEALTIRQTMGTSNSNDSVNALVLEALALKILGANRSLYNDILSSASTNKYIDTNTNLFNQNSYKCFAALAHNNASKERASLINEVLNQQHQKGDFGSTFANAVCSYLLQNNAAEIPEIELAFTLNQDKLNYQYNANSNYWLRLQYKQTIEKTPESAAGLSISRTISVKRDDKWVDIEASSLVIGDLVKTQIIVDSPIARQHIAITDSIAGGFEAISPSQQSLRYSEYFDYSWFRYNAVQIRNGKAFWYINNLQKGQSSFVYLSRVRHSGNFTIAPVYIEAMYRTDVFANSESERVLVK